MSKFTKGKWKINKHFDIYSEDGQFVALCCIKHKEAYLSNKYKEIYTQETKANARLIAAAPEMYELLSSSLEYAEYVEDYFGGKTPEEIPDAYHFIKSIDNLLARIDGERDKACVNS